MACSNGSDGDTSQADPGANSDQPSADGANDIPSTRPVIGVDSWDSVLRNVIPLINAEKALNRHDAILSRVISLSEILIDNVVFNEQSDTLVALGITPMPLSDPDNRFLVDYACNSGGTLNMTLSPGSFNYQMIADDCAINGDVYDGGFSNFGIGREGATSNVDAMTVQLADSTSYSLSGVYQTFFDRPGIRRSYEWTDTLTTDTASGGEYSVSSFNMLSESASGSLGEFFHQASVTGGFDVTAEWTDNLPMNVTVSLSLGGTFPIGEADPDTLPSQWTSGNVLVIAADGSQLELKPNPIDVSRAVVELSDISEPFSILWSDGYQVRCFADAEKFPACQ